MTNKENKRTIKVNGQAVEVTEEVYKEYMRPEWREEQRQYRAWRCRDGKGVRCQKRCEECEYYRMGNKTNGSDLSIEQLQEEEGSIFEIADPTANVEESVARRILREAFQKARTTLSDREQEVLDMLLDLCSERDIANRLGVSNSRAHVIKEKLFKKLRSLLHGYDTYFRG